MSIHESIMLVQLRVNAFGGSKTDRKVTEEVADAHNAKGDVGRFIKRLVPKEALKEWRAVTSRVYNFHYEWTVPWLDGAVRALPTAKYLDYRAELVKYQGEAQQVVAKFIKRYDALIDEAQEQQGTLFNRDDYPAKGEVKDMFEVKAVFMPLPKKDDWRILMTGAEIAKLRTELEAQQQEAITTAMADVWRRLYDGVKHMADQLEPKKVVRDAMVANVTKLVDLLPALNVGGDKTFAKKVVEVRTQLLKYNAGTLREDDKVRTETRTKAKALLKGMEGYVS